MDTSLTPATLPAAAANVQSAAFAMNRLQTMPLRGKFSLAAAAVLLMGLLFYGLSLSRQPDWRVLYASLNDKDGGAVIAALTQLNVPHKFSDSGGAILVPANLVHEARLKLASQGLPRGGAVGFELMENQKFGTTQFQERLNFQRGLEGELARSIMALSAVQAARVHLALPQQTAFMREQQKPSASVLLSLYGGRTLERSQIAGIVHLVASSVPELSPQAVSVVDQTGTLLSQTPGEVPNGMDAPQLQYVRQTEQNLAARILAIVEPLVGAGNVKAQVTADVDFTQSESTAEMYGPNQGASPAAVRSQHLSETPNQSGAGGGVSGAGSVSTAGGVPGALSNQPPNTASSPVNGAAQALGNPAAAAGGGGVTVKRDAVTNYEVDKTVKVVRSASGILRRLNAAVVINHVNAAGADGKPSQKALTAAQMEQINALVREAIGFNKDRGDSVNVVNAPFSTQTQDPVADLPLWRQPQTLELVRSIGPWLGLPLVALALIFGLVRPALKSAQVAGSKQRALSATVQDPLSLPTPGQTLTAAADRMLLPDGQPSELQQSRTQQLENIRQLVKDNPATVVNVVRNWAGQPS